MLLDRGADINTQGGNYGTALQVVCYRRIASIVQLLLNRSADVNIQGGEYENALQAALMFSPYSALNSQVVKMLWDAGVRLYTMPSAVHSEEYIAQLPKMNSTVLDESAKAPNIRSSRRRSWS